MFRTMDILSVPLMPAMVLRHIMVGNSIVTNYTKAVLFSKSFQSHTPSDYDLFFIAWLFDKPMSLSDADVPVTSDQERR
jgi:hypothetical protein